MSIPYGKLDFEDEATRLYETEVREQFFAAAYDRFPNHQTSQILDAAEWILDEFAGAFSSRYSGSDWDSISEHLNTHIYNGLT